MELIAEEGKGTLLYLRHSGEGQSFLEVLKQYASDKPEPVAGASEEQRDFGVGAQILRSIGMQKLRLITNRPRTRVGLLGFGLEITENIALDG